MAQKRRKCVDDPVGQAQPPTAMVTTTTNPLITRLHGLIDKVNETVKKQEVITIPTAMQKAVDADLMGIISSCERMLENSEKAAGEFLHNLGTEKPDVNDVQKVIDTYPESLLHKNKKGEIPIQNLAARFTDGIRYVPLLAHEASRRKNVLERGGLLLPDIVRPNYNILQDMVGSWDDERPNWYDTLCMQVLKELRGSGLLRDQDFYQFDLIGYASHKESFKRLDYLLEINPKSLSIHLPNGNLPIHLSNYATPEDINVFERLLKAGMQYYPENFGFMFQQNGAGEMAIMQAIEEYGKEQTLQIIQNIIPSSANHPILHHVFQYTPSLCDDFICRYPDALYLKDRRGRYLLHVAVRRGLKLSPSLLMMINSSKASILKKKDPVTNLYPFMLAATSGWQKDLTTIYKLLTLRPEVISKCLNNEHMG